MCEFFTIEHWQKAGIGISQIREKKRYFLSSARHRGSCAMKLSEVGDEILLKNEKIKFCEKSLIF